MSSLLRSTTICGLALSAVVVGCARRPALTSMAAPSPSPGGVSSTSSESAATSAAAPKAGSETIVAPEQRETTTVVTERPNPATFAETNQLGNVYFDFDKYTIGPAEAKTLEDNATWLKSNDVLVIIEGQCDERGTDEYNLALGERRARAAKNYLVSYGIAADRITMLSYGKERPVCTDHNEECWALNRRAHFVVKPRG